LTDLGVDVIQPRSVAKSEQDYPPPISIRQPFSILRASLTHLLTIHPNRAPTLSSPPPQYLFLIILLFNVCYYFNSILNYLLSYLLLASILLLYFIIHCVIMV